MRETRPVDDARWAKSTSIEPDVPWTERLRAIRARADEIRKARRGVPGVLALSDAPESSQQVTIDLDSNHLDIRTDKGLIGSWNLDEIDVVPQARGFRLMVEGEELLLLTENDTVIAASLGLEDGGDEFRHISGR